MAKINWSRVILGGLVAGLIFNIFGFVVDGVILSKDWASTMAALGKPQVNGAAVGVFILWGFLMGIAAVWFYAAIRPRYGAGVKTALCAGSAVWLVGVALAGLGPLALGLFPGSLVLTDAVVGLVEMEVGTTVGAWLYREKVA
jgi:hypothetical protein